jgi:hypothetical protein
VTYGTVTNIPGETSKCWLTQNLGADNQATSAEDATEPSAGWYWQFNLKQGYKHDGATRTPNTTWITPINEYSDWVISKDPCSLLLGGAWRIPTLTEWTNVDNAGGWNNLYDAYNSNLKLHTGGYLTGADGSLVSRGTWGLYWASDEVDNVLGGYLYFYLYECNPGWCWKDFGVTLRCIKE